ncbi:type II toxin-antitoxin system VapC family toxin [Pararhizobium qamdonense]|uniref:type II toxin-antitoxin system VapC family toxin n=1 Tax=Pararhizobium qamdonense TaxID=3031126 RepID=UPI0023E0DD74|nr:type II toxin-antitoxin system VapC family toxin [Pararhizobium qamdonense]
MILVVDASVAVMWFIKEMGHDKALALAEHGNILITPDLIFPEVGNVLRRKVRQGLISETQASMAVQRLPDAFRRIVPCADLIDNAFSMASQLDHSVYDALYLACAMVQPDGKLVTVDEKFRAKATAAGYGEKILNLDAAYALVTTSQENDNG